MFPKTFDILTDALSKLSEEERNKIISEIQEINKPHIVRMKNLATAVMDKRESEVAKIFNKKGEGE